MGVGLPEGIVTFLLTDIEGSTSLWEAHSAAMSAALARHEALIAEVVASHGGRLIKSRGEGDSTLSVFVRATDAVAAALAMQQALAAQAWPEDIALSTRVALHSGEAELRDGDYYGQTLNRAARLRALAQGGHVVLSQGTAELAMDHLPPEASVVDLGNHPLRGLSRPEHVFALAHPGIGPPPQLDPAPSAASAPAFVGREGELAQLDAALNAILGASAAGGRVVLVTGEAGIGKSALVRWFTERHSADARFLFGACDPLLTPRALGPLHDVARQTGGRLAELLRAASPREQLFAALLDELDRRARPQVVVVEDAHWADEATLDLLVFLGRRIERTHAVLIVTYRDDELAADHPLLAVVGSLPQAAVRRVRVQPLSEVAVAELASRAGRAATGLRGLTGGNALLVTEVLTAGDTDVPLTVRDLVLARLAALPREAHEVARLVAVVPTRAELWLLQAASHATSSAVEACEVAGLLVVDEEFVGFRHELLRRAVEGSLSPLDRRELHRRVLLELVDARGEAGREVDIARLVHHAREVGDSEAVLRYVPEAARQAAAVGAHREAAGHYQAALPYAARLAPGARADLLEGYSVEAYLSGLPAEAVSARQAAVRLRQDADDQEKLGEGLRWLSRLHWWAGNRQEAEAAARHAIDVLEGQEPGRQLAMAYSNQAQLDMLGYRLEAATRWATRAIELARRVGDQEALVHAMTNIGSARLLAGDRGGRADLQQAFELAMTAGLEDHAARALTNLGSLTLDARDYQQAGSYLDRAMAFVEARDLVGYAQNLHGERAGMRLDLGDWAGAEQEAQAALAERLGSGIWAMSALVILGRLQARRGDPQAAATLEEAAERMHGNSELQWVGRLAAARAEHAWLQGDLERVIAEVRSAYELAVQVGHPWLAGELAFWMWMGGESPPTPDEARVMGEPYRLLLAGDWRGAADAWRALGCPYDRAQALAHGGDEEALSEALRVLDGLGARQTARRVRQLRDGGHGGHGGQRAPGGPTKAAAGE